MPESDRLYVMTKNYKVDVRLLSTRNLEVKLTKKVSKDDMKLDVTVLLSIFCTAVQSHLYSLY